MPSFIVELHQSGGCDYTIECDTKVRRLDATTMEEARIEVEALLEEEYSGREFQVESAMIYEVARSNSADVKGIYRDIAERQKAAKKLDDDAKARRQLAALKKRFPDG